VTQRGTAIQSILAHRERHASSSSISSFDSLCEDRPEVVRASNDITTEQLPLPVSENLHREEISTSSNQNAEDGMEADVESRNPANDRTIKLEPDDNPIGLNQHHLGLIYQTENGKLFCGLCVCVSFTPTCMPLPSCADLMLIPPDAQKIRVHRLPPFTLGLRIKLLLSIAI
jgi:hypothetical protein